MGIFENCLARSLAKRVACPGHKLTLHTLVTRSDGSEVVMWLNSRTCDLFSASAKLLTMKQKDVEVLLHVHRWKMWKEALRSPPRQP